MSKRVDLAGQRFGMLVAIDRSSKRVGKTGIMQSFWRCQCDCGNVHVINLSTLRSGSARSCGCLSSTRRRHERFEAISPTYWRHVERQAQSRGLAFDLTQEQAWRAYVIQAGHCALTGVAIDIARDWGLCKSGIKISQSASLDRIDSSCGYSIGNIRWVHKDINRMKQDFDDSRFFELCQAVVTNFCSSVPWYAKEHSPAPLVAPESALREIAAVVERYGTPVGLP
jgi:hypothetical protein